MLYIAKVDNVFKKVAKEEIEKFKDKGLDVKVVCKIIESKSFMKYDEISNTTTIYHVYKCKSDKVFIEKEVTSKNIAYTIIAKVHESFEAINTFEEAQESLRLALAKRKEEVE
jgi:uncharacterized membrane protein